tara:strand:+ start:2306 stop:2647 length:342 start_codon:yes stop_codon:yes gene_type:complete
MLEKIDMEAEEKCSQQFKRDKEEHERYKFLKREYDLAPQDYLKYGINLKMTIDELKNNTVECCICLHLIKRNEGIPFSKNGTTCCARVKYHAACINKWKKETCPQCNTCFDCV